MTKEDIELVVEIIADPIKEFVERKVNARLAPIERQLGLTPPAQGDALALDDLRAQIAAAALRARTMTRAETRTRARAAIDEAGDTACMQLAAGLLGAVARGELTLEAAVDAYDGAADYAIAARRSAYEQNRGISRQILRVGLCGMR